MHVNLVPWAKTRSRYTRKSWAKAGSNSVQPSMGQGWAFDLGLLFNSNLVRGLAQSKNFRIQKQFS